MDCAFSVKAHFFKQKVYTNRPYARIAARCPTGQLSWLSTLFSFCFNFSNPAISSLRENRSLTIWEKINTVEVLWFFSNPRRYLKLPPWSHLSFLLKLGDNRLPVSLSLSQARRQQAPSLSLSLSPLISSLTTVSSLSLSLSLPCLWSYPWPQRAATPRRGSLWFFSPHCRPFDLISLSLSSSARHNQVISLEKKKKKKKKPHKLP